MEKYTKVPVVDVHKDNLESIWCGLLRAIHEATFIALDTELSGLGERKKLIAKSIDDRYKNLVEVAKSKSILAVGISCFQEYKDTCNSTSDNSKTGKSNITYKVCTFNLSVLCNQEFVVEPASLQFLIQHGFDFNKQFAQGISYHKGPDKEQCDYTKPSIRNLFAHILLSSKPVVLHNGLLDLVFLYHNFYTNIPDKLEVFTTDVNGMFSAGVLDTKYIAEFKLREPASYLSYIFRKCQRYNTTCKESSQRHAMVEFIVDPSHRQWMEQLYCHVLKADDTDGISGIQICDLYAAHGFCRHGVDCSLSHDIDHILDKEEKVSKKKRKSKKRKHNNEVEPNSTPSKRPTKDIELVTPTTQEAQASRGTHTIYPENTTEHCGSEISISRTNNVTGGHRAGIDAYMTGYCLATYLLQCGHDDVHDSSLVNKISLSGKEIPLSLTSSHFSKPSASHVNKMEIIKTKMQC